MDRIAAAAEAIAGDRLVGRPLDTLPEAVRPRDESEAYAVQQAVHTRLTGGALFGRRVGTKIGCTTPVMQTYLGIPNPCSGAVFAGGVHASGATVAFDTYRRIGVECEIAIRLAHDLEIAGVPCTVGRAADAVSEFMPAIEIVDDRYVDWRQTDTPTLIADDFFAAGCVLGDPVPSVDSPADLVGTTTINGVETGRGRGADVMGSPLNALAWLANDLATRGQTLKRGEIVLTGSLVETKWLERGDRVSVFISGLGAVDFGVG